MSELKIFLFYDGEDNIITCNKNKDEAEKCVIEWAFNEIGVTPEEYKKTLSLWGEYTIKEGDPIFI